MHLSVIGCGYLGAVHAAAMAQLGHTVVGIDVDANKIAKLAAGIAPFFEPGLNEVLARNVATGKLTFSTDYAAISGSQVYFIGVGTPQSDSGSADLSYVHAAVNSMLPYLGKCTAGLELVVGKSTVPVGTAARLSAQLEPYATLIWNPEFLREGFAVKDTLEPDRMVYGLPENATLAAEATAVLDQVYAPIINSGTPRLTMNYASAELVKISANAFLATKISFINAMAQVCDAAGADVTALAQALGLDERIGSRFLRAGIGFGGGCLPKDIRAFQARAQELGVGKALGFLAQVDALNASMCTHAVQQAEHLLGNLDGKRIAVLGATFKPNSDDMRNSPALDLARTLSAAGAQVTIHDPQAGKILKAQAQRAALPFAVADTLTQALKGAELTILATEWDEYCHCDPVAARAQVRLPNLIDGRNALDRDAWKAAGWNYVGIGRR